MQRQTEPQHFDSAELACIASIKTVNKLQVNEKSQALARRFEQLGDIYQQRGKLLHDVRQQLKAVTLYQLALAYEEQQLISVAEKNSLQTEDRTISSDRRKGKERIYDAEYKSGAQAGDVEIISREDAIGDEIGQSNVLEDTLNSTQIKLVEKIKAIEISLVHSFGGQSSEQTEEEYWKQCQEAKRTLNEIREQARKELALLEEKEITVQEIYQHIAEGLKKLVKQMIEKSMKCLPPPNGCVYSFIALGSLARAEATPYSDFEFAILYQDQGEEKNKIHKKYFRKLTNLIWIKVLNLGETTARMMDIENLNWMPENEGPCRKGFSFDGQMEDGCHTPLGNLHHTTAKIARIRANKKISEQEKDGLIEKIRDSGYELIGTPEKLAQFQTQKWENKRGFQTVLSTVDLILSNDKSQSLSLIRIYETEISRIFNEQMINSSKTLIQERSLKFLSQSVERFQFRGGKFDTGMHYFDAKYHLYRLPNMLIDHLASYYGVEEKNLWNRIEGIFGNSGKLKNKVGAYNLKSVVSEILKLRLIAYLSKECRDDRIVALNMRQGKTNQELSAKCLGIDWPILLQIYSVLIPLQWAVEELIEPWENFGNSLDESTFCDKSPFIEGWLYRILLDFSSAKVAYEKAYQDYSIRYGESSLFAASVLYNLGQIYVDIGSYSEALVRFNKAKEIFKSSDIRLADTLINLGNVYYKQARYAKALASVKEAKQIFKKLYRKDPTWIAGIYNDLGNIYLEERKHKKAIRNYIKAKTILTPLSDTGAKKAVVINNLAAAYESKNRYDLAFKKGKKAKNIYTKLYGKEHIAVAQTLSNIANIYQAKPNYEKALKKYEKAERIIEQVHSNEHILIAKIHDNLSIIYEQLNDYSKAIFSLEKALNIKIKAYGVFHKAIAETLNSIGTIYNKQMLYEEGIKLLLMAKQVAFDIKDKQLMASVLINLGYIYENQRNYKRAMSTYKQARLIAKSCNENLLLAKTYNNLATVYYKEAHYQKALITYKEAKYTYVEIYPKEHPVIADISLNTGNIYLQQMHYTKARKKYRKAKKIYIKNGFRKDHLSVIQSYINVGVTYFKQGRYKEAVKRYKMAKQSMGTPGSSQHHSLSAMIRINLGLAYIEQKRFEKARACFLEAKDIYELISPFDVKKMEQYLRISSLREENSAILKQIETGGIRNLNHKHFNMNVKLAHQSYEEGNLPWAYEHFNILIMLNKKDFFAYCYLACLTHIRAQIEKEEGTDHEYYDYLKKAESYFKQAMKSENDIVYVQYAQFMLKNHKYYKLDDIICYLFRAIRAKRQTNYIKFGRVERLTVDGVLQELIDREGTIKLKPRIFAYYLLVHAYLTDKRVFEAEKTLNELEVELNKNEVDRESNIAHLVEATKRIIQDSKSEFIQNILEGEELNFNGDTRSSDKLNSCPVLSDDMMNVSLKADTFDLQQGKQNRYRESEKIYAERIFAVMFKAAEKERERLTRITSPSFRKVENSQTNDNIISHSNSPRSKTAVSFCTQSMQTTFRLIKEHRLIVSTTIVASITVVGFFSMRNKITSIIEEKVLNHCVDISHSC